MTPTSASKTLYADQEHAGIRIAIPLVLIVASVAVFIIANLLLADLPPGGIGDYAVFSSCVLGIVIGLGVAGIAEMILKRKWHSGHTVYLDNDGIRVEMPEQSVVQIVAGKRFLQLCWHFALKGYPRGGRERRVVSSWSCLGCQVQQDDDRFIAYTFMPPKKAEHITSRREFHEIRPSDFHEGSAVRNLVRAPSRPPLPSSVLAGKDGPFWLAERRRWEEGLELTPDDFETLLDWLEEHQQA
jgi:hypothetical protein